jgi:acyl carrier protein
MAITCESIADTIEEFIRTEFRVSSQDPAFGRDVNLYDLGFVDSTGLVSLISFAESHFKIKIDERHLFSEDFTTINGISRAIQACAEQT